MASTDYPGGAGLGILDGCYSTDDAALLKLIKEANGIIMGKARVLWHSSAALACHLLTPPLPPSAPADQRA